jgi:transposase
MRIGHRKRRVEHCLDDGFANGSDKLSGLCEILLNNFHKPWTFTKIHGVEATKNLAERDLCTLVIWRKKSFGTRSNRGQRFLERIASVVEAAKRHGKNALRSIQDAVASFCSGMPAPHICEGLGI